MHTFIAHFTYWVYWIICLGGWLKHLNTNLRFSLSHFLNNPLQRALQYCNNYSLMVNKLLNLNILNLLCVFR